MKWSQKIKNCNFDILLNLALAALLLFFVFIIPPFQKPDEPYHYHQALAYSLGNFSSNSEKFIDQTWTNLPQLTLVDIANHQDLRYDWKEVEKNLQRSYGNEIRYQGNIHFWNITYLPEATGLLLGRLIFPISPYQALFSFYLGRLLIAAVFFMAVLFLQRKVVKKYRALFLVSVFMPMLLNQVSAFSYDGLLIIATLFAFAALTRVFEKKDAQKWSLIFAFALIFMQWLKPGYYLLPFAIFLLPIENFSKEKKKFLFLFALYFFLAFLPFFLNFLYIRAYAQELGSIIEGRYVNSGQQMAVFFSQPFVFVKALLITNYHVFGDYFTQGVGILGWLEYKLPSWFYYLYLLAFAVSLFVLFRKEKKYYFSPFRFIWLSGILIGSFIFIDFAMYISWSEVSSYVINGVQGRYFFPLLPFLFFFLHDAAVFLRKNFWARKVLVTMLLMAMAFTLLYSTYNRFYNLHTQWQNTDVVLADLEQKSQSDQSKSFSLPVSLEATASRQTTGFAIAIDHYEATQAANLLYQIRDADCQKVLLQAFVSPEDRYENAILLVKHQLLGAGEYCYQIQDVSNSPSPFQLRGEDSAFIDVLLLP